MKSILGSNVLFMMSAGEFSRIFFNFLIRTVTYSLI